MQLPRVRPSSREAAEPLTQTNPGRKDETPSAAARTGSETTDLRDPQDFQHIAAFADALFRSLPSDLGLRGFDRIAPALEQGIKNHPFTVACDGKEDPLTEATCRRLGYLMYRHRRRVVAILRQRYIDADTGSQIESSFAARVTATQRGNSAVKGSSESEQRDDKPDSSSVVKDEV